MSEKLIELLIEARDAEFCLTSAIGRALIDETITDETVYRLLHLSRAGDYNAAIALLQNSQIVTDSVTKPADDKLICWVDGGCHNNGSENAFAYGSFKIGNRFKSGIIGFPNITTNNQAEYAALLKLVQQLDAFSNEGAIEVRMDSQLVVNQMAGTWKFNNNGLRILCQAIKREAEAGNITLNMVWVPRDEIVAQLGH